MLETKPYCLAVQVLRHRDGQIDTNELAAFLDETAGPGQWLMATEWLFRAPPPLFRPGALTVPVVCPGDAARRIRVADAEHERVHHADVIADAELRRWRWVAFQRRPDPGGRGLFPWECSEGVRLNG